MTTRRYRITHTTRLAYDQPVSASHNEVRMTPLTEHGQLALETRLRVRPVTANASYTDYWGSLVSVIESLSPHDELTIEAVSTVERTDDLPEEPLDQPWGWDDLTRDDVTDELYEFLAQTGRTRIDQLVIDEVGEQVAGLSPAETVQRVCQLVFDRVAYQPGATTVHAGAQEVWEDGRGVCQDISHVVLGLLRGLRIPARYVSGYLVPTGDLQVGQSVSGESHAWVEFHLGNFHGGHWHGVDATNLRPVGLDHVVVARGRDYDDVPPMRGVYQGVGTAQPQVQVSFTRLG